MKTAAIISLVVLSLWSALRAVEISYICICGNCGWIPNPWVLFHVGSIALSVISIVRMRKHDFPALRTSLRCACAVLAVQALGTAMYVRAIIAGDDYFDLILFIPLALACVSTGCVWKLKHPIKEQGANSPPEPAASGGHGST